MVSPISLVHFTSMVKVRWLKWDSNHGDQSLLRGCQTYDKVGQFCLPIKSANKNLSPIVQKNGRICLPLKLSVSDFNVQLEHALFSTRKPPNLYVVILKQMYDQQIACRVTNSRPISSSFYVVSQSKNKAT